MVRTQVQLEEETFDAVRRMAFERRMSVSAVVREILRDALGVKGHAHKRLKLSFIAAGDSGRTDISENHDRYLAEDFE